LAEFRQCLANGTLNPFEQGSTPLLPPCRLVGKPGLYRFDPRMFIDQPIHLSKLLNRDFMVIVAQHTAGRIFARLRSSRKHVGLWTVTEPIYRAPDATEAEALDLPDAKKSFRATLDAWLHWAIRQNAPVTWHE